MDNLEKFLSGLPREEVWMYFFASGCEICPAHEYCSAQPDGTCCKENFMAWAQKET